MEKLLLILSLPGVFAPDTWIPHYISCNGFPDGFHEAGCWGKAVCVNGDPVVTLCNAGEMYDAATDACVSTSQNLYTTACNTPVDCSQQVDGRHADLNAACRSYYICLNGAFLGRMYCPPQTFFNEALQVCDYYGDTPHPCGSHTGGYSNTPAGPWPEVTGIVG